MNSNVNLITRIMGGEICSLFAYLYFKKFLQVTQSTYKKEEGEGRRRRGGGSSMEKQAPLSSLCQFLGR